MYDEYTDNSANNYNSDNNTNSFGGNYNANDYYNTDYNNNQSNNYSNDYNNDYNDNYTNSDYVSGDNNLDSEDSLLSQIDAFRDKAKELQSLINEREKMAGQGGVPTANISKELDRMIQSVNTSLSAITTRLNQQDNTLANIESTLSAQDGALSGIADKLSMQDNTLSGIDNRLNTSSEEASDLPASGDIRESLDALKSDISKLSADTRSMQEDISEKIHSENVKVYRNLNDVIKENDKGDDNKNEIIKKIKGAKTSANLAMIFGIFDFAGIGALVYLMLKMTGML